MRVYWRMMRRGSDTGRESGEPQEYRFRTDFIVKRDGRGVSTLVKVSVVKSMFKWSFLSCLKTKTLLTVKLWL